MLLPPRRSHKCRYFALLGSERDVAQHLLACLVSKIDLVKTDVVTLYRAILIALLCGHVVHLTYAVDTHIE